MNDYQRKIFYLTTKPKYYHKPTYKSLEDSLVNLRDLCLRYHITELAMPKIGCGLDLLEWNLVSRIIDQIFENQPIKITVYSLLKNEEQ